MTNTYWRAACSTGSHADGDLKSTKNLRFTAGSDISRLLCRMRFIYRKGSTQFGSAVVDRNYLALATFIASVWIIPQSAIAWSCTSDGQLYDCQRPIPGTYSGDVSHQWIGWVRNVTAGPRKASIIKPLETAISEETAKSLLSYRSVYSQCSGTDGKPLQTVMRGSDVPSAASDFYVYQSGEYYFGESINWCQNGSIRVTYPIQGEYSARFNIPRIDQCAPGTIKWDWDYGNLGHDTDLVDYAICYIPVEQSCPAFGDPITATGTKFQTEVDWSEPNAFLQLRRTYVSSPRFDGGAMGAYTLGRLMPNWRFGFQSYIGFDGDQVTVFREDSKSVSFAKIGNDLVPVVPGKTALTQLASGDFLFRSGDNLFEIYDPTGKLQKIVGSAGLNATLNYTNSGEISSIVDGFGRSLLFHYYKLDDGDGVMYSYLDSVSLPDDSLVDYGVLSPRGVLSSVNYADGSGRSYGYADMGGKGPLLLTQVNDEEGASFGTKYSSSGMSIATSAPRDIDDWAIVDKRVSGSGDIIVTDPLAQELRLSYSKVNGRSLLGGQSRPGGSGCSANVSSQSYDANSNVTNKVDFGGNRSCFAYNTSRNLETARIEGLSGATACPADVASYSVVSSATAPQRKVTTQWHPVWNLQTRVAEPNLITTTVYNGLPDPIAGDTPVCAPDAPLLPDGSKIAVVCRRYEEATTDTLGNVGFAATVTERRSWSYTYNVYGQMQIETDPRGKRTTYKYWDATSFTGEGAAARGHTLGDLKTVTQGPSTASPLRTQYTEYNKLGQVLTTVLPNGSTESREYHLRGWLSKLTQTPAGGGTGLVTSYDYYATGLLKQVTQPDGSWTLNTYDDAHRLTDVSNSDGNSEHYELDNAGNRTSESYYKGTDPATRTLVKTITRTYDALGRMQSVSGLQ